MPKLKFKIAAGEGISQASRGFLQQNFPPELLAQLEFWGGVIEVEVKPTAPSRIKTDEKLLAELRQRRLAGGEVANELEWLTVDKLKRLCGLENIKGYTGKRKAWLVERLGQALSLEKTPEEPRKPGGQAPKKGKASGGKHGGDSGGVVSPDPDTGIPELVKKLAEARGDDAFRLEQLKRVDKQKLMEICKEIKAWPLPGNISKKAIVDEIVSFFTYQDNFELISKGHKA